MTIRNDILDQIATEIDQAARQIEATERAIAATPALDTADLWRLFRSDSARAWTALAGLSEQQLVVQATAMASYLYDAENTLISAERVLSDWQTKLAKRAAAQVDWTSITHEYARACIINFYMAEADVAQRRRENGDEEAARWFERFLVGESIAWSTRCDAPAITTDLDIPALDTILTIAQERGETAQRYGDDAGVRQLDRLRMNLLKGATLQWHRGDLLIQSVNNPGLVYRVNARGCSCPNGMAGRSSCWHVALYDLLIDLQEQAAIDADMQADVLALQGEEPEPPRPTIGQRIAAARAASAWWQQEAA